MLLELGCVPSALEYAAIPVCILIVGTQAAAWTVMGADTCDLYRRHNCSCMTATFDGDIRQGRNCAAELCLL